MTLQILGGGCAKCHQLEKEARAALVDLGLDVAVEKITDFAKIAEMGVMATPALAIDNVVKSAGKVLTKEQVKQLVQGMDKG